MILFKYPIFSKRKAKNQLRPLATCLSNNVCELLYDLSLIEQFTEAYLHNMSIIAKDSRHAAG